MTISDFPHPNSSVSAPKVERLVAAIVANMAPSVADIATRGWLHGAPAELDLACPAGGWMSYVRRGEDHKFEVPDGISAKPIGDGVLLLSTREDYVDADPDHVRRANLLNRALAAVRESENDFATRRAPSHLGTGI